jgi:preprotein translocase subunit SecG
MKDFSSLMEQLSEELVLSGTYDCNVVGYDLVLASVTWILGTVWEVVALCLMAWVAVRHYRELQQRPTGWRVVGDCFTVLIKHHMLYFAG